MDRGLGPIRVSSIKTDIEPENKNKTKVEHTNKTKKQTLFEKLLGELGGGLRPGFQGSSEFSREKSIWNQTNQTTRENKNNKSTHIFQKLLGELGGGSEARGLGPI